MAGIVNIRKPGSLRWRQDNRGLFLSQDDLVVFIDGEAAGSKHPEVNVALATLARKISRAKPNMSRAVIQ